MIKILITGHEGYIGSFLYKELKKKFFIKKLNLKKIPKDNVLKKYTHLLHFQFLIKNKKKNIKINLKDILKIINICIRNNIFLIFPSTSSFVYKNKKRVSEEINAFNYYTIAKKKIENLILDNYQYKKLKFTIIRIFNVYGENINSKSFISNIFKQFKEGLINIKYYENVRDYLHIKDLLSLIKKCIIKKKIGIYEAGSGKSISIKKLARIISKNTKMKHKINFLKPRKTKKNFYSKSNIKKTINAFNWKPKIFIEYGIKKLSQKYLSS